MIDDVTIVALKSDLRRDEGEKLFPYVDTAGKITIGIGHNLTDLGITTEESAIILQDDVMRVAIRCGKFSWFPKLSSIRQRVVLNMVFNLGLSGFLEFKETIACIGTEDYAGAAKNMENSQWATQVGARATRLIYMMANNAEAPVAEAA